MSPVHFLIITFVLSVAAGLFGSLLGLGGGTIVLPALTLLLHIDIRYAIGASVVSVIATSSGAAAAFVKEHMSNLRVAMWLEIGTTAGAITGAYVAGVVNDRVLFIIFGIVLGYSALRMLAKARQVEAQPPADPWADRLQLHDHYFDHVDNRVVHYRVARSRLGLLLMYIAGVVSGLLGIGSGALKVPAMDLAMRLPIKVSTATSNFMIGVTAAASAGVYFARGDINPFIAAPVMLGVLSGATLGSRLLRRIESGMIRALFVVVLLMIAGRMLWQGFLPGGPRA
ncbi:MAG TPA: sulfite exporter TauE/SafE family protein [Phycisphaerae bacterium]|nr:sulfite exporter TauE/SafE family protein [Phycisphaerae bacterium]